MLIANNKNTENNDTKRPNSIFLFLYSLLITPWTVSIWQGHLQPCQKKMTQNTVEPCGQKTQLSYCHGVRWHSSAIAMGSDDTVQPFSDATFPEISGIPDIGKSIRPIRKPSGNPTNRELYVSTLLNEVVKSHHAESSGNFVRLLWHPWPLPWSQMTQFSHSHGVRWHSSAIAMGSDDTVQPLPWGQMTQFSHCHGVRWHSSAIQWCHISRNFRNSGYRKIHPSHPETLQKSDEPRILCVYIVEWSGQKSSRRKFRKFCQALVASLAIAMESDDTVQPLPWGQMTQFSHCHGVRWHSSAIAMGSDDSSATAMGSDDTVQPLPWGQITQFSHCHGVRWHSSATAMGSDDTVQKLPWGQMTQFSHCHGVRWHSSAIHIDKADSI